MEISKVLVISKLQANSLHRFPTTGESANSESPSGSVICSIKVKKHSSNMIPFTKKSLHQCNAYYNEAMMLEMKKKKKSNKTMGAKSMFLFVSRSKTNTFLMVFFSPSS